MPPRGGVECRVPAERRRCAPGDRGEAARGVAFHRSWSHLRSPLRSKLTVQFDVASVRLIVPTSESPLNVSVTWSVPAGGLHVAAIEQGPTLFTQAMNVTTPVATSL